MPALAPAQRCWSATDASEVLLRAALDFIEDKASDPDSGSVLRSVCGRLGVSDRHLRRVFQKRLGVSPLAHLLTRRLLNAKQLLTDTELGIESVAHLSGFGSVRRFNELFLQRYGIAPGRWRKAAIDPGTVPGEPRLTPESHAPDAHFTLRWRPPVQLESLIGFLSERQIDGIEHFRPLADGHFIVRTVTLMVNGTLQNGWISLRTRMQQFDVQVSVSAHLQAFLPTVVKRVRHWLDLDADPEAIHARLQPAFPRSFGLRLPGTLDGFELAVRAILGQQITVKAARTLTSRLVQAMGEPIDTPDASVNRLFPSPQALIDASEDELGRLGITRQRQKAIRAVAQAVKDDRLWLQPGARIDEVLEQLQALPGIGPWTAAYIAMRACNWTDAWLPGDVVLAQALGIAVGKSKLERQLFEDSANGWRPWRAYAVLALWAGLHEPAQAPVLSESGSHF